MRRDHYLTEFNLDECVLDGACRQRPLDAQLSNLRVSVCERARV